MDDPPGRHSCRISGEGGNFPKDEGGKRSFKLYMCPSISNQDLHLVDQAVNARLDASSGGALPLRVSTLDHSFLEPVSGSPSKEAILPGSVQIRKQ